MKIALFYPRNQFAGWYSLGGYANTLRALGHDVIDVWLPGNEVHKNTDLLLRRPSVDVLSQQDVIIIAYAEYVVGWLHELYRLEGWRRIKTPKILRFDESFDRADLRDRMDFPFLKLWGDHYSFPAAQDARRYGGTFLPFGADETIFHPANLGLNAGMGLEKKYGLGFIGGVYRRRAEYADLLSRHLGGIPFSGGPVEVRDLSGIPAIGYEQIQTELYAQNLRQIKVFFCLPPLSQLLVAKVFEVMGCGTFLMYPRLEGEGAENLGVFTDKVDLVYYRPYDYVDNARMIKYFLEHDEERETIAAHGARTVRDLYSLKNMMQKMLEPVEKAVLV